MGDNGAALHADFGAARREIIVMLDADGWMCPPEIASFIDALVAGADFVKGWRFLRGGASHDMEWCRRLVSLGFVTISKHLFGCKYPEWFCSCITTEMNSRSRP